MLLQLCACLSLCFLSTLECGDLPSYSNKMKRVALLIIEESALIYQPVETAIGPENAIYDLVWRLRAIMFSEKRKCLLSIFRVDQRAKVGKILLGIRGQAQQSLAFGTPEMLIAHDIPIIHANSCGLHRHAVAILVKGKRGLPDRDDNRSRSLGKLMSDLFASRSPGRSLDLGEVLIRKEAL